MSKLELKKINGNSYYFLARLAVGAIVNPANKQVILIDSCLDENSARAIWTALRDEGLTVAAIINTHSHADHCGGNAFFQAQNPQLKIYASAFEKHFIETPFLEPYYFSMGAVPFKELRIKFLEAIPSVVTDVIPYVDGKIAINDIPLEIITLPGHAFGAIGIGNAVDRVFYCGDALFDEATLSKHKVPYFADINAARNSWQKLLAIVERYGSFVLYHGGLVKDLAQCIAANHARFNEIENFIYTQVSQSIAVDAVLQAIITKYNIPQEIAPYHLTRTCVLAYLAGLQQQNKIGITVKNGILFSTPKFL